MLNIRFVDTRDQIVSHMLGETKVYDRRGEVDHVTKS